MAKQDDLISQSDVAKWGSLAIFAGGVAVVSTVLSLALPPTLLSALHASRTPFGMNAQVETTLREVLSDQDTILRENDILRLQVAQLEQERNLVAERVGALETAIPMLLEAVPPDQEIDRSIATGSIESDGAVSSFEADGGTVEVSQRPLFDNVPIDLQALALVQQSLPSLSTEEILDATSNPEPIPSEDSVAELEMAPTDFGVAIGAILPAEAMVDDAVAKSYWDDILNKVGLLLIGLDPQVADPLSSGSPRLVAGPLPDLSAAESICSRIVQVGIDCLPVQYAHQPDALIAQN